MQVTEFNSLWVISRSTCIQEQKQQQAAGCNTLQILNNQLVEFSLLCFPSVQLSFYNFQIILRSDFSEIFFIIWSVKKCWFYHFLQPWSKMVVYNWFLYEDELFLFRNFDLRNVKMLRTVGLWFNKLERYLCNQDLV